MRTSAVVFRFVIALSVTYAVLALALLPFLDPGSHPWMVSLFTLVAAAVMFLIAAVGLRRGWDPFRAFEYE